MRFKPKTQPVSQATPAGVDLPRAAAEAIEQAVIHQRTEAEDHERIAVQLPGGRAWLYGGQDEAVSKLAESMALDQEQAREAAKRLDTRIRGMVHSARRARRTAASWINRY